MSRIFFMTHSHELYFLDYTQDRKYNQSRTLTKRRPKGAEVGL